MLSTTGSQSTGTKRHHLNTAAHTKQQHGAEKQSASAAGPQCKANAAQQIATNCQLEHTKKSC